MKIFSALNQPLGIGRGAGMERDNLAVGVQQPKLWVDIAAAIAALIAGVTTSAISGAKASKASREAERRQRRAESEENAWYTRKYNERYVDTAAGQNLVSRAKEFANKQWKRAAGEQAVTGGTDAATAMAKEAGNKMVGDTVADIAATDVQRRDNLDQMHRQAGQQFAQMDMDRELQRAQNITAAGQQASNAMMSAAGVLSSAGQGNSSKANLSGGSNNSIKVKVNPSVHESNLRVSKQATQPFGTTNDNTLYDMAAKVRQKLGV